MNIIEASLCSNLEVVKALIAAGADVNVKDEDGWTALYEASRGGYLEIAEYLKQNGAKE